MFPSNIVPPNPSLATFCGSMFSSAESLWLSTAAITSTTYPGYTNTDPEEGALSMYFSVQSSLRFIPFREFGDTTLPRSNALWSRTKTRTCHTSIGLSFLSSLIADLETSKQRIPLKKWKHTITIFGPLQHNPHAVSTALFLEETFKFIIGRLLLRHRLCPLW